MPIYLLMCIAGAVITGILSGFTPLWLPFVSFALLAAVPSLTYWGILGLLSLPISLKKEYSEPSPFYLRCLNAAYLFTCFAGRVKLKVIGLDKLPKNERFLLVSNHLSRFDPMIQSLALRKTPLAFISKPENFKIPIGRRFMNRSCYIAIDRSSAKKASASINRAAELLKNGKVSIGVYPEGTRGTSYDLQEFKPGCLKAATKANAPIAVAVITGTENIRKNSPWRSTPVTLEVITVLRPDKEKTTELSERIRNIMQDRLNQRKEEKKHDLYSV